MKILFCSSEVVPFSKTGGLADVCGALPLALEKLGYQVTISTPFYRQTKDLKIKTSTIGRSALGGKNLDRDILLTRVGKNVNVFLIKKDIYFDRDSLYSTKEGDYPDNLERFSFFCRKTLDSLKKLNYKPDIIHCHDWQSALIPVYLKTVYRGDSFYKNIKTILTIHNLGYQGIFTKEKFPLLGLDWSLFNVEGLEFYDRINILKGGINFSDVITTVSPAYSEEIQTKEQGFGLEGVLTKRKNFLLGILNGIDYSVWDPVTDKNIFKNYSISKIEDKYVNKERLQKLCNLPVKDSLLIGMVGRLAEQKGLDLLAESMEEIFSLDLQMIILGTGDLRYHNILEEKRKKYPKKLSVHLGFSDPLAHKIYAGSDIFLIPSKYEPCGLGQMIAYKYGTIPLVHRVGGLKDTVFDFDPFSKRGNGFAFSSFTKDNFLKTLKFALYIYSKDKKIWIDLVKKVMQFDFSWGESAKKYIELYKKVVNSR